jgi:hypothetical protein
MSTLPPVNGESNAIPAHLEVLARRCLAGVPFLLTPEEGEEVYRTYCASGLVYEYDTEEEVTAALSALAVA